MSAVLIYGAYGYSGKLIAEHAIEQGVPIIVSGRSQEKCEALATELKCESRAFPLDEKVGSVLAEMKDVSVVLNCAGPFTRTFDMMVKGCIEAKKHYLDITGEIQIFEAAAALTEEAKAAGVMVMPGVGFDVVPSDSLAAHLLGKLPTATDLELGFQSNGGMSHGTLQTAIDSMGKTTGTFARREGKITGIDYTTKKISFKLEDGEPAAPVDSSAIPWGDVSTAFYTTGIPNITVYIASPGVTGWGMWLTQKGYINWLLRADWFKNLLKKNITTTGPTKEQRESAMTHLWGKVTDSKTNESVEARITVSSGYKFTYLAAVHIAQKVLAGQHPEGFQTPAGAYGEGVVLEVNPDAAFV